MATLKSTEFRNYCDRMYDELSGMKSKLLGFVGEIEHMNGPEKKMLEAHVPHFQDIIRTIDWKLEILTRVCPYEWSGYAGIERIASVRVPEDFGPKEIIPGGFIGG